jgi:predicted component of type VI protein secretion system
MSDTTIPTYDEALAMLAAKAEEGSVTAIVALERALRNREAEAADEVGEAIDRILNKADR